MPDANDRPRLIEAAFPLKQTSLDSVHEKNVRHGHISTLHIWPARRPLAACRAALIATLLPDPGTQEGRKAICERIGGKLIKTVKKKKMPNGVTEEREVEETVGGILHWGRESENKDDIAWFRNEIRRAHGGRAPKVLDPFAGGGAIPLEAMRLGCDVTAIDINPVAWFLLKATLEYPQKLAGQKLPLPDFALRDRALMQEFFESQGLKKTQVRTFLHMVDLEGPRKQHQIPGLDRAFLEAGLAWHVRAWGRFVLNAARKELASRYPQFADYQALTEGGKSYLQQPLRLVPTDSEGRPDIAALNREFEGKASPNNGDKRWLEDLTCPRWVGKPTVAYLWARTVRCKQCRASIPLLKTRWLTKKDRKRVLLRMEPNSDHSGVEFGVESNVTSAGGNNAARREHDKRIGQGTMSRAGAWCPSCGKPGTVAMEMEDIRQEGLAGRLGSVMTAVVVDGPHGKEYRLPTAEELAATQTNDEDLDRVFDIIPFGALDEPTPKGGGAGAGRAFSIQGYGMMKWRDLFTPRQLLSLATFVRLVRTTQQAMQERNYGQNWVEALSAYLSLMVDRLANQSSTIAHWNQGGEKIEGTFARFALPIMWDFAEVQPLSETSGAFQSAVDWVALASDHVADAASASPGARCIRRSAIGFDVADYDVIVTDPPYYDAIPYSDLMDFFYLWLRRCHGDREVGRDAFASPLSPKWDHATNDGELIDDSSRHDNNAARSKQVYEDGMARAFQACYASLGPEGRLVIVFANKQPDAWETLVSAIIRAGFIVDGSWPIQTERTARVRSIASAALASSVWLVCKKRPATARPGWDNAVLVDMRTRIHEQLQTFWDAGIRGPDFVWAATGPAMEAFSKHPIVKKADEPGQLMTVSEFLRAVRRIVVDFVVGRVLSEATQTQSVEALASGLDDVTTYYLLHRHDFGLDDAPAGACILYAVSCNLSEGELADRFDILLRSGGRDSDEDGGTDEADGDAEDDGEEGTGSTFRLKTWKQRTRPGMGVETNAEKMKRPAGPSAGTAEAVAIGRPTPIIDQVHRLMHLWKAGDQVRVDQYLEDRALRRNAVFQPLLQALIELATEGSEERAVLETIMNHVRARGIAATQTPELPFVEIRANQNEEGGR